MKAQRRAADARCSSSGSWPGSSGCAAALAAIEAVRAAGGDGPLPLGRPHRRRARSRGVLDRIRERHGPHRRAAARGRPRDQPPLADKAAARVRPRLRRQERRLVQPPARGRRPADRRDGRRSARSPAGSATRGQTDYSAANDLLCKITSSFRRHPAGHPRHRDRLDGVGRHRHGDPRLDPEDHGDGRHRHAAAGGRHRRIRRELTAGRSAARSSSPARSACWPASYDATGGLDPARSTPSASGPMVGAVTGMGVCSTGSSSRRRSTRGAAVPRRPPDRRDPGAARRDGHRGVRRGGQPARAGLVRRRTSRTSTSWPRSSSTGTSRARSPWQRVIRPDGGGPASRTARSRRSGSCQGSETPRRTMHFTGRSGWRPARGPSGATTPARRKARRAAAGHGDIYRVYFHGPAYRVVDEAWRDDGAAVGRLAADLPADHDAGDATHRGRAAAGGAVLPDRRPLGDRPRPGGWRCPPTSTGVTDAAPAREHGRAARSRSSIRSSDGSFDCQVVDGDGDVLLRRRRLPHGGAARPPARTICSAIHAAMSG